jgi:hypothetical protein
MKLYAGALKWWRAYWCVLRALQNSRQAHSSGFTRQTEDTKIVIMQLKCPLNCSLYASVMFYIAPDLKCICNERRSGNWLKSRINELVVITLFYFKLSGKSVSEMAANHLKTVGELAHQKAVSSTTQTVGNTRHNINTLNQTE